MIDFHCHVLPYIDDGSKNFDMSLSMLNISKGEGIKVMCATPHFISGETEVDRLTYDNKINGLKQLCSMKDIDIQILSGLEVYMSPDLPSLYKEKRIWGYNDKQYMLIELPMENFPIYTESVLYELRLSGAVPIIAHPERNLRIVENINLLTDIVEQGTLVQVNAGSISGLYGRKVKDFAEELVKRNLIHVIGSDGHNDKSRVPSIESACKYIKDKNPMLFDYITDSGAKIISGEYIEPLEYKKIKNKKKFFSFLGIKK